MNREAKRQELIQRYITHYNYSSSENIILLLQWNSFTLGPYPEELENIILEMLNENPEYADYTLEMKTGMFSKGNTILSCCCQVRAPRLVKAILDIKKEGKAQIDVYQPNINCETALTLTMFPIDFFKENLDLNAYSSEMIIRMRQIIKMLLESDDSDPLLKKPCFGRYETKKEVLINNIKEGIKLLDLEAEKLGIDDGFNLSEILEKAITEEDKILSIALNRIDPKGKIPEDVESTIASYLDNKPHPRGSIRPELEEGIKTNKGGKRRKTKRRKYKKSKKSRRYRKYK